MTKYHPCINCGKPAELHTSQELKECYNQWSKVMTLDGQIVDENGESYHSYMCPRCSSFDVQVITQDENRQDVIQCNNCSAQFGEHEG